MVLVTRGKSYQNITIYNAPCLGRAPIPQGSYVAIRGFRCVRRGLSV